MDKILKAVHTTKLNSENVVDRNSRYIDTNIDRYILANLPSKLIELSEISLKIKNILLERKNGLFGSLVFGQEQLVKQESNKLKLNGILSVPSLADEIQDEQNKIKPINQKIEESYIKSEFQSKNDKKLKQF
jgi:hypothetical protein